MAVVDRASGPRGAVVWWVAALSALALGLALASAPVAQARAEDTPVQQAVTLDSPAVVRIVSAVQAQLTCAACAPDGTDIVSPAPGSAPFTYFSSGSGAFISPDGAILTADHVVDHSINNPEDVSFVEQQAAQDIAQRPQYNMTADQAIQLLQNNSHVSIQFSVRVQRAYLSTAYTGALHDTQHIYAFDISAIVASSPVLKQDTAIVRINTAGVRPAPDFPYLTLTTAPVQALDNVTAIAFPADADLALTAADFTELVNPQQSDPNTLTSLLSPSVNQGSVTNANEVRSDGTPVYEATGIGSNGSSGGPVINDQGQVIGFVDAGPSTGRLTFITPSTVVAPYAVKAGVANPPQGRFMGLWSKALSDYYATGNCHWTNAAADFATLSKQYPQFDGDAALANNARLKAAGESCSTTGGASTGGGSRGDALAGLAIIGGCLLAVMLLIGGVLFLVIAMIRRKPAPKPAVAPGYQLPPPPASPPVIPPAPIARPNTPIVSGPAQNYPPAPAPRGLPQSPYSPASPPAPGPYTPSAYAPGAQFPRQPAPNAPVSPIPTRFCTNGHVVMEADASFCPLCGSPVSASPQR